MSLYKYFSDFYDVRDILNTEYIKVSKSNFNMNNLLITLDYNTRDNNIYVVCSSLTEAQSYYESLCKYVDPNKCLFFPADELITQDMLIASPDLMYERITTLINLLEPSKKIIVTNTNGIIKKVLPKNILENNLIHIKKGNTYDINKLISTLIINGYTKVSQTKATGEYSKRGEIIDIFILGHDHPIRIDFFDDEVESIKYFDINTQRSFKEIDEVIILPVTEFIFKDDLLNQAKEKINYLIANNNSNSTVIDNINNDFFNLEQRYKLSMYLKYIDLFYDNVSNIVSYTNNNRIYFIDEARIEDSYNNILKDYLEYINRFNYNLDLFSAISLKNIKPNVLIEGYRNINDETITLNIDDVPYYASKMNAVISDIKKNFNSKKYLICLNNEDRIKNFKLSLIEERIYYNEGTIENPKGNVSIFFTTTNLPSVCFNKENFIILNEENLYSILETKKSKYKSIYKNASKISHYSDLEIGDYVVHYDHGIGIYKGLSTLETDGINRDYLTILYAEDSNLFIPVNMINKVMKYAAKGTPGIQVHELNSSRWKKTKERVRKKIKDISDKLIKIYANRKKAKGYSFPPDDYETKLFEETFNFELTPDQEKAINVVKKEMESENIMDRLICGDVGYGKTEIALRASFKAVKGGKQVCLLCPTTILSRQHYETFTKRMKDFNIRIALVNRFVKPSEIKKIKEDLFFNKIDIIIGTHKLLSNDFIYNDLGLLVIDEEQRFGVTHKEKIKEIKANVDCITLSATPIPRTLQMSLLGIKDLSMIETPPKNRYPIQTYVLGRNMGVIRDAVEREIARGGQVFYLYNRVESIEEVMHKLMLEIPHARFCFIHGRLTPQELEDTLIKFIDKEYDCLVCTTIIETGIDIPECNTLIVHDATTLGLAQMYQIRGRVGRSDKIAYAYLMYDDKKILTENSIKRLEAIKDLNDLGSGYKIAMRDLAIRGSGDILGAEQSGFIDSVGIDMYLKLLDEEINKKTDIEDDNKFNKKPLLSMSINKKYIDNEDIRIDIHKRIQNLNNINELSSLEEELKDRFGVIDKDTYNYMYETLLKNLLNKLNFESINLIANTYECVLSLAESANIDGKKWFKLLEKHKNIFLKYQFSKVYLLRNNVRNKLDAFKDIINYLSDVLSL